MRGKRRLEKSKENKKINAKKMITPAVRVVMVMLAVTAVAYPLSLLAIGQKILPTQTNGTLVNLNGKPAGSMLVAQDFMSPKFFHPRAASDSASAVDPHITLEDAFSQVKRISKATGIAENPLKTLIRLDAETNKSENLGAFAPDYVNVLRINLELMDQYPDVYKEFSKARSGQ